MNIRLVWAVVFLASAALVGAEPRTASGLDQGPVVATVSGAQGAVNLSHQGTVVRGWVFPGPFSAAVILAGPLDTVEWDGEPATLVPSGTDPVATARQALASSQAPRQLLIQTDGGAQVILAPDDEKDKDYDAASAATAE